jgi:hypothetical protein
MVLTTAHCSEGMMTYLELLLAVQPALLLLGESMVIVKAAPVVRLVE